MSLDEAIEEMQSVDRAGVFRWPKNKALAKTPLLLSKYQRDKDNVTRMHQLVERDNALILQTDEYKPALHKWQRYAEKYLGGKEFTETEIRAFYDAHQKLLSFYRQFC